MSQNSWQNLSSVDKVTREKEVTALCWSDDQQTEVHLVLVHVSSIKCFGYYVVVIIVHHSHYYTSFKCCILQI